jgi:hypothetical protein
VKRGEQAELALEQKSVWVTGTGLSLESRRYQMQLSYTYWGAKEGGYIGYLNQYPDYWTQGGNVEELEKMLISLYGDIIQFDDVQSAVPEYTGFVAVPA